MIAHPTITPADPPTPDTTPPPWTRHPLAPPAKTMREMQALARNLALATGQPVAILRGGSGLWLATPSDRACQWAADIASGRARIVETIEPCGPRCAGMVPGQCTNVATVGTFCAGCAAALDRLIAELEG